MLYYIGENQIACHCDCIIYILKVIEKVYDFNKITAKEQIVYLCDLMPVKGVCERGPIQEDENPKYPECNHKSCT